MYPIRDWILRFKTETLRKKIDLPDNWLLVSLNKHNWSECLCMIFKQFCVCVERLKVGKREHNKKPRSIVIGRKFFIIPLHISPSVFSPPFYLCVITLYLYDVCVFISSLLIECALRILRDHCLGAKFAVESVLVSLVRLWWDTLHRI